MTAYLHRTDIKRSRARLLWLAALGAAAITAITAGPARAQTHYTVTNLNPPADLTAAYPVGGYFGQLLNDSGQAVVHAEVYALDSNNQPTASAMAALLYADGAVTDVGAGFGSYPWGGYTFNRAAQVNAINAAGQLAGWAVVYAPDYRGQNAFFYDPTTGQARDLSDKIAANYGTRSDGSTYSWATGINNAGKVAGWADGWNGDTNKGLNAFVYDPSTDQLFNLSALLTAHFGGLNQANQTWNYASAINTSGQVVGAAQAITHNPNGSLSGRQVSYLYDPGDPVSPIHELSKADSNGSIGVTYSYAKAINDSGQVVGAAGVVDGAGKFRGNRAYYYDHGSGNLVDLGALLHLGTDWSGASESEATAVNAAGQAIGWAKVYRSTGDEMGRSAFVYDYAAGKMTDLGGLIQAKLKTSANMLVLSQPEAINAGGDVVGRALVAIDNGAGSNLTYLGYRGWVYRGGQVHILDATSLGSGFTGTIWDASAINAGGQIAATVLFNNTIRAVLLTPTNTPPAAAPDNASTLLGQPVTLSVLLNDTDTDGDALTITRVTQPAHGAATINPGASGNPDTVTYMPATGFSGTDTFTYTISDGWGGQATATVTVTVDRHNAPPRAVTDNVFVDLGGTIQIDVLANDTDPDGDTLYLTDGFSQGTDGGQVSRSGNLLIYKAPSTRPHGPDTFTYQIRDAAGNTAIGRVIVLVK